MAQIVLTDATPLIYLSQTTGGLSWLSSLFGPVSVATICRAKEVGLILSAREVFEDLRQKGFRVGDDILSAALEGVKEATGGKGRVLLAARKTQGSSAKNADPEPARPSALL